MNDKAQIKPQDKVDTAIKPAVETTKSASDTVAMGNGILTITGPETGRRRAGHVFGKEPVDVDASTLTQAQVNTLLADPLLSVKQGQ